MALKVIVAVSIAAGFTFGVAGSASAAVTVAAASFETPITSSYTYNPVVAGTTFSGGAGVQANWSAFGYPIAPNGVQTAFLQTGGQIALNLSNLVIGNTYNVLFSASGRYGYMSNPFTVSIGGFTLGSFDDAATHFSNFATTTGYTATATNAVLTFASTATTGDHNVALDNVAVTGAVPEPATWALMILGMGAVGYAMRRKMRLSDTKFYARIKAVICGAVA